MYGAWIRAAREQKGLTLTEAAKAAGLTIDGLSKIERNINGATMRTLQRLANTYNCQVGDLLPNSSSISVWEEFKPLYEAVRGLSPIQRRAVLASMAVQANLLQTLIAGYEETSARPVAEGFHVAGDRPELPIEFEFLDQVTTHETPSETTKAARHAKHPAGKVSRRTGNRGDDDAPR